MVVTLVTGKMNMAVKTQNCSVLLRRPLPPKVLSPLPTTREKYGKKSRPSREKEICQKDAQLPPLSGHEKEHVCGFLADVHQLYKPQGPDPLPARSPRHGRENPYELPVDHRFIHSPMFTLEDFLRKWEKVRKIRGQSPERKKYIREKNRASRDYKLLQQQEVYRQICVADNADLPNPLSRKPQRQIITELAAAILSYEGEMLDTKITEILDQVEAPKYRPPLWAVPALHASTAGPPLDVSLTHSTLEEWSSELSSAEITGASDIVNVLMRSKRVMETRETGDEPDLETIIVSKSETSPETQVRISRSSMLRSQGRTRRSSPFDDDRGLLSPAEFVVVDTTVRGYTTLDLKGYFINQLPNIEALTLQLTVVNLSFNNFETFPPQIFALKNLESLNVRDNPIKEIPVEIAKLCRLQTLIISFCLISNLPSSLFTLEKLKVLDVSYNCLKFIPNDIAKLRYLVEFNAEGNELGDFPGEIIKLPLKYFRMGNNFTHPLFWKETTNNQPQRLFHMAARVVVSNGFLFATSDEIKKQLKRRGVCDCCDGPVFGSGVKIIKAIPKLLDIKNLPLSFVVCSQTCRRAFKKDDHAISNWLKKHFPAGNN